MIKSKISGEVQILKKEEEYSAIVSEVIYLEDAKLMINKTQKLIESVKERKKVAK